MVPNDRFTRQADLVPRDRLRELRACVIGIGAVGRQVALQLAALGTRQIQLVDFDRVEPTNVTTQAYGCHDVGQLKVVATSQAIRRIDPGIQVESVVDRYRPSIALGQAVFCCVDTITARSAIWRTAGPRCRFWSDARILAEVIRVLAGYALRAGSGSNRPLHSAEHHLHGQLGRRADAAPVHALAASPPDRPRYHR